MHSPIDASTIIFALLAIFILWKLRSVLGTRTGHEKEPPPNSFFRRVSDKQEPNDGKVVPLPGAAEEPRPALAPPNPPPTDRWTDKSETGASVAAGLEAIAKADPSFSVDAFVAGAKTAYEMIVGAFADGDRQILHNLLESDVYQSFTTAIGARESRSETLKTTLISIDKVKIDEASLRNKVARITLRFTSKLVSVTEDKSGAVVEGSPDKVFEIIDIWTFARDTGSRDPNWKLAATRTEHPDH